MLDVIIWAKAIGTKTVKLLLNQKSDSCLNATGTYREDFSKCLSLNRVCFLVRAGSICRNIGAMYRCYRYRIGDFRYFVILFQTV